MSNLLITNGKTPGHYLLPGGNAVSADLLVDAVDVRPQADCVRLAWGPKFVAKRSMKSFEQYVRPMVAEGTTGIPPSAPTRCP